MLTSRRPLPALWQTWAPSDVRRKGGAPGLSQTSGLSQSVRGGGGVGGRSGYLLSRAVFPQQPAAVDGAMGRRRLITDSFRVVKKKRRAEKARKAQGPSCDAETVQTEALLQDAVQPDLIEVLKQFDLNWKFGPCTGITRLQRWERAELLGLSPPPTVREVLMKYKGNSTIVHSLWHEYSL